MESTMKASYRDPREYSSFRPTAKPSSPLRQRSRMDDMQRRIDELETINAQLNSICKALKSESAHKQEESQRKIRLCETSWAQIHVDNIQQKKHIKQQKEIIANHSETIREQRIQMRAMLDGEAQHREIIVSHIKTIQVQNEDINHLKIQVDTLTDEVELLKLRNFIQQETIISLDAQLSDEADDAMIQNNAAKNIQEQKEIIENQSETIRKQKLQIEAMLDDEAQNINFMSFQQEHDNSIEQQMNTLTADHNQLKTEYENMTKHLQNVIAENNQLKAKADKISNTDKPAIHKTEIVLAPTRIQILEDAVAEAYERLATAASVAEKALTARMQIFEDTINDANERLMAAKVAENDSAIRIKNLEDALSNANKRLAAAAATEKASAACINILEDAIAKHRAAL